MKANDPNKLPLTEGCVPQFNICYELLMETDSRATQMLDLTWLGNLY